MEGLKVSVKDGVKILKFCNVQRRNAVNRPIYSKITEILNQDANNDDIKITIFTGEGDYFSSGNDLKAAFEPNDDRDPEVIRREANQIVKRFIQALINYPKLLIAVVNGPAIGIGTTMATLCDIVYASDRATFHTPFVHLGLCCEGCSSYQFPLIMGRSKASEMLLLGKKISAMEAFQSNLVARVVPYEKLGQLFEELQSYASLPLKAILVNKKLVLDGFKTNLHDCNNRECEALIERTGSEEFFNAIANFLSRKSKL